MRRNYLVTVAYRGLFGDAKNRTEEIQASSYKIRTGCADQATYLAINNTKSALSLCGVLNVEILYSSTILLSEIPTISE